MGYGNQPTKPDNANRPSIDLHGNASPAIYSEPWWCSTGYNPAPSVVAAGNASNQLSRSLESNNVQSLSKSRPTEGDDDDNNGSRKSQKEAAHQQERSLHRDENNSMPDAPTSGTDNSIAQHPQLELVGHTIACAPTPYQDPFYGGMMAAYGPQPLIYPHPLGPHHARMQLPLEVAQEPVYVNAKQYHGILRRRQSRAKAELEKKLIKVRKPYLHESRHQHAIRRARGTGGRFAKKTDAENKGPAAAQSVSSSGSEAMPSDSAETWNSPRGQEEANRFGSRTHNEQLKLINLDKNGGHASGSAFQPTPYHSGSKNEENDCSTQQWGSISSNNQATSQRRFAIQ
ncbi:hypothetical protein QQ045_025421 [Rhodiola kirilowii]